MKSAETHHHQKETADADLPEHVKDQVEEEKIVWRPFVIPENLQMEAEKAFALALQPVVFESHWEEVKLVETVKKKTGLFSVKLEKVVRLKKKEIKVPVQITTPVITRGFIEEGVVICSFKTNPAGKKQKEVAAIKKNEKDKGSSAAEKSAPVSAEGTYAGEGTALALGKGVMRRGHEVIAQVTGFIRRGKDWVDIIPYIETTFIVYPTSDAKHCFLDFIPGTTLWPAPREIIESALELNFKREDLLSEKEVEQILDNARKNFRPLQRISLLIPRDAGFEITVAPDKMQATLTLRKGKGVGKALALKEVGKAILDSGLQLKDIKKVQADILAFYKGPQSDLMDYPLATGQAPVRGKNGDLRYLIEFLAPDAIAKLKYKLDKSYALPTQSSSGGVAVRGMATQKSVPLKISFPLESVEYIAHVTKDQKIAELTPPTPGQAGKDVFGHVMPGVNGNDPDLKVFENLRISQNTLIATISGLLLLGRKGETILVHVLEYKEGQLQLTLSEDFMQCTLSLSPPQGGEPITLETIKAEMTKLGIIRGIDEPLLVQLLTKAEAGEPLANVLIAKGQPPVHKTGSQLVFYCQVAAGKMLYREEDEKSKPKYIQKDGLIAEIRSVSVPPQAGWDLKGQVLEFKEENPINIEVGKNVKRFMAQDGSVKYFAEAGGEVFYDGHLLEVKDKLSLEKNLLPENGPVQFSGSVSINGDVKAGCRVFSGADIHVDGLVEEAVLSAEGSIFIKEGVKGQGKAVLRAKHHLDLRYVEKAMVLVVGDMRIEQSCLQSEIKCNSKIFFKSAESYLIGGNIKTKKGLEVVHLGSKRELKTLISFGQDYLVEDQIELEEKEIEKLKIKIYKYDLEMHKQARDKVINQQVLDNLRTEKLKALKLMEKRSIRLFNLKEKFEEHFPSEIIVKGNLFPGVMLESHGRTYEVKAKKEKLIIFFNAEIGKIQEKSLR